jgi:glycosyltransferase involved in cell wall biosynthesis
MSATALKGVPPATRAAAPPRRRIRVTTLLGQVDERAGGAERFAVALATRLDQQRFEVRVCATRALRGSLDADLDAAGVERIAFGRRSRLDVARLRPLAGMLQGGGCDVLHAHMFGSNVWAAAFGRACHVPVVLAHEHGSAYGENRARRLVTREVIAPRVTRFIAVSEAERRSLVELEGVPDDKAIVMPNAYIPRPIGAGADLRRELGLAADVPLIGAVAMHRPEKALDVLLDAHALVLKRHPDAVLVLAGDGAGRAALEAQANALRIASRVRFLGVREDIGGVLAAIDIAAISSDREGTPLAALEFLAAGVPLVATNVGGIAQLVDGAAMLVPPRDPVALAAALVDLIEDRGKRAELAARGLARSAAFDLDVVAAEYGALYERLLEERLELAA